MRVWSITNDRGEFVRFEEGPVLDLAYLQDGQVARVTVIPNDGQAAVPRDAAWELLERFRTDKERDDPNDPLPPSLLDLAKRCMDWGDEAWNRAGRAAEELAELIRERDAQEKTLAACARLLGDSMPEWTPLPVRELRDARTSQSHAVLDAALAEDLAGMLHILYDMGVPALEALHEAASRVAKEALDACDLFEDT